jgi:hypothetical protein
MIYKAYSCDEKLDCTIEITPLGDEVLFHIEYTEDWQSDGVICISTEDFIKILKGIAVNNDVDGIKLTVTDEVIDV